MQAPHDNTVVKFSPSDEMAADYDKQIRDINGGQRLELVYQLSRRYFAAHPVEDENIDPNTVYKYTKPDLER